MTVHFGTTRRRDDGAHSPQYRWRFGLPGDAVRPLFTDPGPGLHPAVGRGRAADAGPYALALYEPGLSRGRRLLARLGTSGTVAVGRRPRPVSTKGLVSVSVGGIAGMMLAQPFDAVTFVAPLYGLVVGGVAGAVGWTAVRGRRATVIVVDDWRPQLEAIERILHNADRIGQPFASPAALRVAIHGALWHAAAAVGQPGDDDVLHAFDEQLTALREATESALVELESPSIAARKAAVSERLADAVSELKLMPVLDDPDSGGGGDQ